MKIQLADGWNNIHKRWSTWLTLAGSTLTIWANMIPDNAYAAWIALPDDVRHVVPEKYLPAVGAIICLAAIAAKAIKQKNLARANPQG